jgi:hydroxypyruvate isomerase
MQKYVINLEMQFHEAASNIIGRIPAAAAAGFNLMEFWRWQELDLDAVERVVKAANASLYSFVVDWAIPATNPDNHAAYLKSWEASLRVAERFGVHNLIALLGNRHGSLSDRQQLDVVAGLLKKLAPQALDAGVTILLEPLNTAVDHPGTWVDTTPRAFELIDAVGSPAVKILFDLYHSFLADEDFATVLEGRSRDLGYVHFADMPGRHEPGAGNLDWKSICALLDRLGYTAPIGLEFTPSRGSAESLRNAIAHLAEFGR